MAYGGSEAGFHFFQDYQRCHKYWYWKYARGLEPLSRSPALIFGESGHEGLEEWYTAMREGLPLANRRDRFRDAFIAALDTRKDLYEYRDTFETDKQRAHQIVDQYCLEYPDEGFTVLGTELLLDYVYPDGKRTTGRLDLVIKDRQGVVKIVDHKFTGWSLANFVKAQTASNQTAQYLNLWNFHYPEEPAYNVVYNVIRNYKGTVNFARPISFKTNEDLKDYLFDLEDVMADLSGRLADPNARWPKNTESCFLYNRPCPFLELCQGVNFQTLLGTHFKVREEDAE